MMSGYQAFLVQCFLLSYDSETQIQTSALKLSDYLSELRVQRLQQSLPLFILPLQTRENKLEERLMA